MKKISEYQKEFEELFMRLQKEHGKPVEVCIEAKYYSFGGIEDGCNVTCNIKFA